MLSGPSGSGKSMLTKKLLENAAKMMIPPPIECIFNYSCWQELYEQIDTPFPIKFVEGISKFEDLPKDRQPRMLIIDDCMDEVANSPDVSDMYTKYSHHYNYSVVALTPNMFAKGKYFRTISLNTQYLWLLKSIRDNSTIKTLGAQMGQQKFLFDCYTDAMKTKYGHLFINLRPSADDNTRVRTKMFDSPSIVYVKK